MTSKRGGDARGVGAAQARQLGLLTTTSLVVASMVGTGVFTTTGLLTTDIPSASGILWCWLVAGVAALCGALAYAELGAALAENGGEYHFLSRLLHPAAGFVSAFVSLIVGFSAPLAAIALAFGHYLAVFVPDLSAPVSGAALIVVVSALNLWRISASARFQDVFTMGKVVLIVVFVVLGWPRGRPELLLAGEPLWPVLASPGFAVGLLLVSFAYTGWNAASYVAGEVTNPAKVLPRALVAGTALVTALYLGLNAVFLRAAPLDRFAGRVDVGHVAAAQLFGDFGGRVLSGIIALGLVSTVGAIVVTGPRIYEAVGRDLPRLSFLARRSARGGPVLAICLQGGLALVMMVSASFDQLLTYIGFTLSVFAALSVAAVFVLRRKKIVSPFRMPGYPITPLCFMALMSWMVVSGIRERPEAALAGLGTVVAGLLFYRLSR